MPALPVSVAETLTLASASTTTVLLATTSTLPPAAGPRAKVFEPPANVILLPESIMRPPCFTITVLSALAVKVPLCLITPAISALAALADNIIKPPGAFTAFLFSIKVSINEGVAVMPER